MVLFRLAVRVLVNSDDKIDKGKAAFAMKFGLWKFNVMPFGLCNSPPTPSRD